MSNLKQGTVGTIIVGIIFLIAGIAYWGDILNSAVPVDWERIKVNEFAPFEEKLGQLKWQVDEAYYTQKITEPQRQVAKRNLEAYAKSGKKHIQKGMEDLKNLTAFFFLMMDPIKFFMYLAVAGWLVVAGIGFIIIFPWPRFFVFTTMIVPYLWQTYTYVYEKKFEIILDRTKADVFGLLDIAVTPAPRFMVDIRTQIEILNTFIFLGMLYYFLVASGSQLFRDKKAGSIDDLAKALDLSE